MATRKEHANRKGRESVSKRIGVRAARAIRARDCDRCVYCGSTAGESGAHLHLDHLTPKSKGGDDSPSNLVLACRSCNSSRQDRSLAAWERYALQTHALVFSARTIRARAARWERYL